MQNPTTKSELLATVQSDYGALLDLVQRFSPDEQQMPGVNDEWAIKDILAHLAAWEQLFLGWYQAGARSETPATPAPGYTWGWKSLGELNQRIYWQYRDESLAEVTHALAASHEQVLALIQTLSEEELFTPGLYGWLGKATLAASIRANTYNHYRWAIKLIRQWEKAQTKRKTN